MALLEVLDGPSKGEVFAVERDEVVVGRLPYCDVVLAQRNVSRQHTRFVRSGNEFFVEDLSSTNGTFLNGKRVRGRTRLNDQDVIRVYNISLMYRTTTGEVSLSRGADGGAVGEGSGEDSGGSDPALETVQVDRYANATRDVGVNAYEKLRTVLAINRALGSTLDIDQVLPKILDGLFTVFPQSDRGFVLFPEADGGRLVIKAQKHKDEGTIVSSSLGTISQSVADRVMSQGEAILSADGVNEEEFDISDSVMDFPIRSMMCAPLLGPLKKPLGIIYVDANDPYERFHEDDLEVLLGVAVAAGQALEYAHSHEIQLRSDRHDREMATAREVQLHFLPQSYPDVSGYRFFEYYMPAEEVGGDYYGYEPLADGRLAVAIGDVSGKGITAALIMASLCNEVRYRLVSAAEPCEAVDQMNREFSKPENDAWFVTFVLCILDPRSHELAIVNAGHMAPLCRRAASGEVEELGGSLAGPPLGCDPSVHYELFTTKLEPGDALLMYTDGVNEAMNSDRELYGLERVKDAVRSGSQDIDRLCDALLGDMRQFTCGLPQNDDTCLIGLQRD